MLVDEDTDSFQFGNFINSLRRKEPLCCKSQTEEKKTVVELRKNKDVEVKAGVEMLSSGPELKCWSQSRSWKYPICFSEDPLV